MEKQDHCPTCGEKWRGCRGAYTADGRGMVAVCRACGRSWHVDVEQLSSVARASLEWERTRGEEVV